MPHVEMRRFLVERFGSNQGVLALFAAYRIRPPTTDSVAKWFQRGNVPSPWFALMLCVLELEEGTPISLSKYFCKTDEGTDDA